MRGKSIYIILLFVFAFCFQGFSQTKKIKKKKNDSSKDFYTADMPYLIYGNRFYSVNFYNQLGQISSPNFALPVRNIGIGGDVFGWNFKGSPWGPQYYFTYIIPDKIRTDDSTNVKINGYSLSFCLGRHLLSNKSRLKFSLAIGLDAGRIKLQGVDIKRKNPFIAPMVSSHSSFFISKRLAVGVLVNYQFDVSDGKWLALKGNSGVIGINNLKQHGLNVFFTVGYQPGKY